MHPAVFVVADATGFFSCKTSVRQVSYGAVRARFALAGSPPLPPSSSLSLHAPSSELAPLTSSLPALPSSSAPWLLFLPRSALTLLSSVAPERSWSSSSSSTAAVSRTEGKPVSQALCMTIKVESSDGCHNKCSACSVLQNYVHRCPASRSIVYGTGGGGGGGVQRFIYTGRPVARCERLLLPKHTWATL